VYIATSDDTMAPDCIEKLVAALDARPDCDIAHCALKPIDQDGNEITAKAQWWLRGSIFAYSSGPLIDRLHVRLAPFDGLLHLLGGSVYISITQLLIRRSLFDRIGYFESTWGSVGDFNWSMRAALAANTVHVPSTWGGWRLHASQATASVVRTSAQHAGKVDAMIDHAIDTSAALIRPELRRLLMGRWRHEARALRAYRREVASRAGAMQRSRFFLRQLFARSPAARTHLRLRLRSRSLLDWVRSCLDDAGFDPFVVPTGAADSRAHGQHIPSSV
jgi:hypothetical protein